MAAKPDIDEEVLAFIKKVETERGELARILGKPSYATNGSFSYSEGRANDAVNIRVEKDVRKLISIAAFVRGREGAYAETATLLGVVDPPAFAWGGFSTEDWMNDLKIAIGKTQVDARRKKLEVLESKLNSLVSPELRRQIELEKIRSELA